MKESVSTMKLTGRLGMRLALLAMVAGLAGCEQKPLEFKVSFADASGVKAGQAVSYRGQKIGEVRKVDVESGKIVVTLAVDPDKRKVVSRESRFSLARPGGVLDRSGEKQVVVKDPEKGSTPIKPGEEIAGEPTLYERGVAQAREAVENLPATGVKLYTTLSDYTSRAKQRWQQFKETPEGKEYLTMLERNTKELVSKGKEQVEVFRRDQLPVLREKAARMRDRMIELGKTKEAQEFWKEFLDWSKSSSAPTPTNGEDKGKSESKPPAHE